MSMYMIIPEFQADVETIKSYKETFYPDTDTKKDKKETELSMFDAFEKMHKQDGTSEGKPKCDTYL